MFSNIGSLHMDLSLLRWIEEEEWVAAEFLGERTCLIE
jgi:hypothetical protein